MTDFKAGDVVQLIDGTSDDREIRDFFNAHPSGIFTVIHVFQYNGHVSLAEDGEHKFSFKNSRFKLFTNASEASSFEVTDNDLEQLLNDGNSA